MFSLPSLRLSVPSFLKQKREPSIRIDPVRLYNIEADDNDKRGRALKHLLRLNHANNSILYNGSRSFNELSHGLCSAYIFDCSEDQLEEIYESGSRLLEKWTASPCEVTGLDWKDFLGDGRYQRAYTDFFEDELVYNGYKWRNVVEKYLFEGHKPLLQCIVGGVGLPLIHLAYAYEMSSKDLAIEALGMVATTYGPMHEYLDEPTPAGVSAWSSKSLREIMGRVAQDLRLDDLHKERSNGNYDHILRNQRDIVLEYWNAWALGDALGQFHESQMIAATLLAATQPTDKAKRHDMFLAQILITSHAVRILLPLIPCEHQIDLLRQWWLLTLVIYIGQLRPTLDELKVLDYDTQGRSWMSLKKEVFEGIYWTDVNFMKALRALEEIAETWGDNDDFILKAATKFCDQFSGWSS